MSDQELLGDKVERVLTKVGGKKVAKAVERVTKKPCGCGKRRTAMNDWHRKQIEKAKQARQARARNTQRRRDDQS